MTEYTRTLPVVDDENRPFWQGARAGVLRVQRCDECGHLRFPIQGTCPRCVSEAATWIPLSGRGHVLARIVYHQAFHPAFRDQTPYNVAFVQLEEGPRMFTNVVVDPPNAVAVGDRVEAVFEPATDEITIPRFRVVSDARRG